MSFTGHNKEVRLGEERARSGTFQSWGKRCKKDMVRLARYIEEIKIPDGDEEDVENGEVIEDGNNQRAEEENIGENDSENDGALAEEEVVEENDSHDENVEAEVEDEDNLEEESGESELENETQGKADKEGNGTGNANANKPEIPCSKECLKKIEALENEANHWKEAYLLLKNRQIILENAVKEFHGNYANFSKSINHVLENKADSERSHRENTPELESDRSSDIMDVFLRSIDEPTSLRSSPAASVTSVPINQASISRKKRRIVNSPQPGPSSQPYPHSPSSPAPSVSSSSSSVVVLSPPPKKRNVEQFGFRKSLDASPPLVINSPLLPDFSNILSSIDNTILHLQNAIANSKPNQAALESLLQQLQCAASSAPQTLNRTIPVYNGSGHFQAPGNFATRTVRSPLLSIRTVRTAVCPTITEAEAAAAASLAAVVQMLRSQKTGKSCAGTDNMRV